MSGNLADGFRLMKTCLIIPCYNEATRIPSAEFTRALQQDDSLQLVFVNDGSKDETFAALKRLRDSQNNTSKSRFHILSYNQNKGKSNAVSLGLNVAYNTMVGKEKPTQETSEIDLVGFDNIEADYFGFWDADLATPFVEVAWFYRFTENYSPQPLLIIGSRVARLGANIQRTLFRHYSGRLFATLISQGLGWKVHDTQCGAKLMQPELIPICFNKPFFTSWLFDVEILLRMQQHYGKKAENMVVEVPLRTWTDVAGSKIGWSDFIKVPYQIWRVFRAYK
jgi:glycosyltransferase involved in cell wall biosynthesis